MKKYLLLIVMIMSISEYVHGQIRYVTPAGAGLKNGTDWLNAYDNTELQYAIEEIAVPQVTQVWVAAGTYTPGNLPGQHFNMKNGVAIYGGFAGTETSLEARNWVTNPTILSGEIGQPGLITDNINNVFYNSQVNNTAILDGFTIRGGYNGIGLGHAGGGIFNYASSPRINNCTITENTGSFGGGIYNTDSSSPLLTNCIITNNAGRRGAGIYSNGSTPTLINCKITYNSASIDGGGVENANFSTATLVNCTIAGNTSLTGGGIYTTDSSIVTITNSIIWNNAATMGGSQVYVETGTTTVDYCCFADGKNNVNTNTGAVFTATNSIVLDPQFVMANGTEFLIAGNSPCVDAGLDSYNNQENDLRGAGFARKLNKADGLPGRIDMGAYEYKFGTDPVGGTTVTWTGATNTDWNIAGNWNPAAIPASTDGATIPGGITNYPVISSSQNCYNLTIETGASLTISSSGSLTVSNAVTNNGTLTIQSNADGFGSLIAKNAVGTGTATAQSYLKANTWNMVSSPLSGQTIAGFLTAPINVNSILTNGTSRGMRDFNPELGTWNNSFTNSTVGNIGEGKGFEVLLQNSSNTAVNFSGSLKAGPVSVSTVLDRWNLVGNPYTSSIGINSHAGSIANFLTHNASNLDPVYGVYVWDQPEGNSETSGQYRAISNVPNPSFSGSALRPGQAFMVKMRPTVAAVSFTDQMQIHHLIQDPPQDLWPTVQLVASINGMKNSTLIAFNSKMTHGLDPTYDAGLFKGETDFAVYTRLVEDNGFSYAIQALPDTKLDTLSVRVGIDSNTGGELTFSAKTFNIPSNYKVILQDKLNNTYNDLTIKDYTTTVDPNTSAFDRFTLRASFFSGATFTWTGTTSTDWTVGSNWNPANVPDKADKAAIPSGVTNYPMINNIQNCYDLIIANGASLTISSKGAITVSNAITNNGILSIQSDADGTGSLIAGSVGGTGTTTDHSYLKANAWNMVSSPLSGQTIASFLTSPGNVTNIETNGSTRGMMDFNPGTDRWNAFFTNSTQGSIGGGKGFSVRLQGSSDAAVTFTGTPQVGSVVSVSAVMDRWNVVGNPYTSAIGINSNAGSAENFLTHNAANLDPIYGLYIWDQLEGNKETSGQYMAISNVPTPAFRGSVFQPGQAFMVRMRPNATVVNFTNQMQIHQTSQDTIQKLWPTIQLTATVNGQKSSTIIAFNSEMTNGLDTTYDAGLLKKDAELEIYTRLVEDNGYSFAIQALPGKDTLNVQVGIDSNPGGPVIFSVDTFNLPTRFKVILEDKLHNTFNDLTVNDYTTNIDPNTSAFDRFMLHTSHVTGIHNLNPAGQLRAYSIRNTQIKVTGSVSKLAIATLYDMQGRVVLVTNLEEGLLNTIRTPNLKSGIYILFVKDNQQVQRFKIPVTQ